MTKKRYLAVVGLLAILIAAGFGVTLILPPARGVTKANFNRIYTGMTKAEVEQVFGRPPNGTFRNPQDESLQQDLWFVISEKEACVTFKDEVVVDKHWDAADTPETILDKL